ncbi:MAG: flagellar hook assembly protein FlgD [Spirochaetes bacterium]|nr:MAG: flagellar hook assembly protein FlgD [Spirochaetota bacterium]
MDISSTLAASDRASLDMQVDAFNKSLNGSSAAHKDLDKDDFLQILVTQLRYQDPTKPMDDKEFIAQMAQFSSLEQMTNMSSEFSELSATLKGAQAMNLLGRDVEIVTGDSFIQGPVEAVTSGSFPQVMVNGAYYDYDDISKVTE